MKLDGTNKNPLVTDVEGKPLYVDGTLYKNLTGALKNAKKYNGDLLIVIDGPEGSGKSTLGDQVCLIADNHFTEDQNCFSAEELIQKSLSAPAWRAKKLDESKEDMDRKRTMSKVNVRLMNFLSQSRQLHQITVVILPSIYDLDAYVAEHRAILLIHCYKHKGKTPGFFAVYGKKGISKLFKWGKKYRNYPVTPSFIGRFTKQVVINMERYNEMKRRAIEKFSRNADTGPSDEERGEITKAFCKERILHLTERKAELKITWDVVAEVLGIAVSTLYNWRTEALEEQKLAADAK